MSTAIVGSTPKQEPATVSPPRVEPSASVTIAMAKRFGMEPAAFEATLRATVVPKDCSSEQFAAFLLVAKEYGLNPITREIFAFPTRGGGIQPIVSIDGWLNIMNSHPQMDGLEFEDHIEDGKLVAVTARIWRKDRAKPTTVTEYMEECKRNTDTWKQWPSRMLRHKAAIQCARYAFGFAGIMDPDEYERWQEREKPACAKPVEQIAPDIPDVPEIPDVETEPPGSADEIMREIEKALEQATSLGEIIAVEREYGPALMNMDGDYRDEAVEMIEAAKASLRAEAAE